MKKILADMSLEEIRGATERYSQPSFRAKQLYEGINKGKTFAEMSNLPKTFIEELSAEYTETGVRIADRLLSAVDGTVKYVYELGDGNVIEGVLMRYKYGNTLCVSTQVGCRMNCAFCASGLDGLVRNLSAGEILGQVIAANRDVGGDGRGVTNVVLMGSGEPLDNYDNVVKFLILINSESGLNISRRNISLSTCGLCDKIYALADSGCGVTLTISLHAPDDEIRARIMPVNAKYKIADIMAAVKYYFEKTGRRIIFEYAMIDGLNDGEENAVKLARLLRGLPCHVNLIRLNYVKERRLRGAGKESVAEFKEVLEREGVSVTLRRTMGSDIAGACGQLRRRYIEEEDRYKR